MKIVRASVLIVFAAACAACGSVSGPGEAPGEATQGGGGQTSLSSSGSGAMDQGTGGTGGSGGTKDPPPEPTLTWWKHIGDEEQDNARAVALDVAGNALVVGDFRGTVDFGGGPVAALGVSDVFVAKYAADGAHLWSKHFGAGVNKATDVALDSKGNVLIIGNFHTFEGGPVDFGGGALANAGADDLFVAKLSPDGEHLWSLSLGTDGFERAGYIACDHEDNVLFAAELDTSRVIVVKLSAGGEQLWANDTGTAWSNLADWPPFTDAAVDSHGDLFVTGRFNGTADFGGGSLGSVGGGDIFIAKYSGKDGAHLWSKRFGDAYSVIAEADEGTGLAIDESDNVIFTGSFRGSVDFGGGPLSSAESGGTPWDDVFLVKLAGDDGSHIWSRNFGSATRDRGSQVAMDPQGNIDVMATLLGPGSVGGGPVEAGPHLAKYRPDGAFLSSRFVSFGLDRMALNKSGAAFFAASFYGEAPIGDTTVKGLGYSDFILAYFAP